MKHLATVFIFLSIAILPLSSSATIGANFSYPGKSKEPPNLHGYQLIVNYDSNRLKWGEHVNVYFDGGYSHFWDHSTTNNNISIYSLAPILRYTFQRKGPVQPYFEVSIGLAYLNHTRIEKRNLGIHFAFQDRMGIGAMLGASEKLSIGLHAVHYSNARFSGHNSGITVPLVLDIGYRVN